MTAGGRPRHFPAFLDLAGRRCVVLGKGRLAEEKAADLRSAGADVVELGEFHDGVLRGAFLAIDATAERAVRERVREEASRERVLLNSVDVPEFCDFIAPAVVRRDPLQIAVGTGGESPFLAAALRARLERLFGSEWGPFTSLVGRVRRRLRAARVPLAEQTRIYRRLLRRRAEPDLEFVAAALEESGPGTGQVALVGAGPGDPSLLTLAAVELLATADDVLYDALVSPAVLAFAGPQSRLQNVGKRAGERGVAQAEINALMIELAAGGRDVVRLKGGDPFVFGRGGEELQALTAAGLDVTVVPGVSSALAAPALAGIPLTLRGIASSVAILTGHDPDRLARSARSADTLVVLMGLDRIEAVTTALGIALGADRPAAAIAEASLPGQREVRSTLGGLPAAVRQARLRPPVTLVVGDVVNAVAADAQAGWEPEDARSVAVR